MSISNNTAPYDSYTKNKYHILKHAYYKYGYINNKIVYDYFFESRHRKMLPCNNFNLTVMISLLKVFKPTNMLDFSAGWGDRLIGAIAYNNTKYTGVDPSKCMYKRYLKMIRKLAKEPNKYRIINQPFEETDLENNVYDFIFTSPPFFTYEIYEKDNKNNLLKILILELWRDNFLYPSLDKCIKHLEVNKYLTLYIDDFKGFEYIDDMLEYMKNKKNVKYSGIVYFYNYDTNKKLRKIYVWKKLNN